MGGYTAIADTSRSIIELLKKKMIPEPIKDEESIGLTSPADGCGYSLGLYLYDTETTPETYSRNRITVDKDHYKEPALSMYLYYMLFAYSESERSSRMTDEQRIMGKALQVLNDYRHIPYEYMIGTMRENSSGIGITNIPVSLEEKAKIWSLFSQPYRMSAFYKAGPIHIDSERIREVKRVTDAEIGIVSK